MVSATGFSATSVMGRLPLALRGRYIGFCLDRHWGREPAVHATVIVRESEGFA
jgi:hypothetical protein